MRFPAGPPVADVSASRYDTQNIHLERFSSANPTLVQLWEDCTAALFDAMGPLHDRRVFVRADDASFAQSIVDFFRSSATRTGDARGPSPESIAVQQGYTFVATAVSVLSLYFMEHSNPLNRITTARIQQSPTGQVHVRTLPRTLQQFVRICCRFLPANPVGSILSRLLLYTLQCQASSPTSCLLFFETAPAARATQPLIVGLLNCLHATIPESVVALDPVGLANVTVMVDIVYRLVAFQFQVGAAIAAASARSDTCPAQTRSKSSDAALLAVCTRVCRMLASGSAWPAGHLEQSPVTTGALSSSARLLLQVVSLNEAIFESSEAQNRFLLALAIYADNLSQLLRTTKDIDDVEIAYLNDTLKPLRGVAHHLAQSLVMSSGEPAHRLAVCSVPKLTRLMTPARSSMSLPKLREQHLKQYVEEPAFFNHLITTVADKYIWLYADVKAIAALCNA